jgi:hypothetical protein
MGNDLDGGYRLQELEINREQPPEDIGEAGIGETAVTGAHGGTKSSQK